MKTKRNRVRGIRWERLLAAMLCLCMMLSVFEQPAAVKAGDAPDVPYTKILLYTWHLDSETNELVKDGTADPIYAVEDDSESGIVTVPEHIGNEKFTAFSVSAGETAVTKLENNVATVTYSPSVHLVKLHAFYTSGDVATGLNFGAKLRDTNGILDGVANNGEVDTLLLEGDEIEQYDVQTTESSVKVYDTSAGLHTDKTASVNEELSKAFGDQIGGDDSVGARTFDVKLESWYAGANLADVGFVLDASGSMAFASKMTDDNRIYIKGYEDYKDEDEAGNRWLSNEDVNERLSELNKDKTDNSLLNYSDYTYFVYDGREGTKEYAPLGYWDGEGLTEHTLPKDTLGDRLIGYYSFDGNTLKNMAPGQNGTAEAEGEVTYSGEAMPKQEGENSLKLYVNAGTKPTDVLLDAKLSNPEAFTISFAIMSNKGSLAEAEDMNILDIGAIDLDKKLDKTKNYYSIYRGIRTGSSANNEQIAWDYKNDEDDHKALLAYNVLQDTKSKKWYYVTYVVKDDKIKLYVDGKYQSETNLTLSEEANRIILGGSSVKHNSGVNLHIDELYIYDRPLADDEIDSLYCLQKGATKNTSNKDITESVYSAEKDDNIFAGVNKDTAEALQKDSSSHAGWYYVNTTSDLAQIAAFKTSKDFRGLKEYNLEADTDKKARLYFYGDAEGEITGKDNKRDIDHYDKGDPDNPTNPKKPLIKPNPPWKEQEGEDISYPYDRIKTGPVRFYIDPTGYLCCIFSSESGRLNYSYVYKKTDEETIKREQLQEALGDFVHELDQSSPQSQVAAVRFSTNKYANSLDELVMLDWTDDPSTSASILNLKRGNGAADDSERSENGIEQYNYLMTGGTYAYTGLQAFENLLKRSSAPNTGESEPKASKYLILFTDGQDGEIDDGTDEAKTVAQKLRDDDWTIYCVMLPSAGQELNPSVQRFLSSLAGGKGSDPEDDKMNTYVFSASALLGTDEETKTGLQAAFSKILSQIKVNLEGYKVKDYIDPRFDLIATVSDKQQLIHLDANGMIWMEDVPTKTVDGPAAAVVEPRKISDGGEPVEVNAAGKAKSATLKWDETQKMYYLEWEDQTILGCSVNAPVLYVWSATITLRAKEDFIGGNAVLTNGQKDEMNYVYHPDDEGASSGINDMAGGDLTNAETDPTVYPSKGFPRVTVNVGMLVCCQEAMKIQRRFIWARQWIRL